MRDGEEIKEMALTAHKRAKLKITAGELIREVEQFREYRNERTNSRLVDTKEWVEFYLAVKAMEDSSPI